MARPRIYASAKEKQRAYRARLAASRVHRLDAPPPAVVAVVDHADPVGALAAWAAETLIVPPGHPRSGQTMALPPFAVRTGCGRRGTRTNRRSARLARTQNRDCGGPGARLFGGTAAASWLARGDCVSITKEKAGELRRQVAEIAEASNLDIRIRRSPYPGVIESATGSLDTLSADQAVGPQQRL